MATIFEALGMDEKVYLPKFNNILATIYKNEAFFAPVFGGQMQFKTDGLTFNKKAFSVKTNNQPVVADGYGQTDADGNLQLDSNGQIVTAGTGFKDPTVVISQDLDVDYAWQHGTSELLDGTIANDDMASLITSRLAVIQRDFMKFYDKRAAMYLRSAANIKHTLSINGLSSITDSELLDCFDDLAVQYNNLGLIGTPTAYIRQELYNALLRSAQTVAGKGSSINIDNGHITAFHDFKITTCPSNYFQDNEVGFIAVDDSAIQFEGFAALELKDPEARVNSQRLNVLVRGGEYMPAESQKSVGQILWAAPSTTTPAK